MALAATVKMEDSSPFGEDADRNVMINYLPRTYGTEDLQSLLQAYGVIEACKVVMDNQTNRSKGYGFVKFSTGPEADNAIAQLNGFELEGKKLKLHKAAYRDSPAQLYVAGFDPSLPGSELIAFFGNFGSVKAMKPITSQAGKKGVCFITMSNYAEADAAIRGANGATFGVDQLTVKLAPTSVVDRSKQKATVTGHRFSPYARPGQRGGQPMQPTPVQLPGTSFIPYLPQALAPPGLAPPPPPAGPFIAPATATVTAAVSTAQHFAAVPQHQLPVAPTYCLFVYGLPSNVDQAAVWRLFGPYGAVTDVSIPLDKEGKGRGYGFVYMPNWNEAELAIRGLNGYVEPTWPHAIPLQVSLKQQKVK